MISVVCDWCGWTHMGISREHAEREVKSFNEFFDTLPKEKQDQYYGGHKSTIESYRCHCGSQNFTPGDTAPDGSTIGPVIYEPEKDKSEKDNEE